MMIMSPLLTVATVIDWAIAALVMTQAVRPARRQFRGQHASERDAHHGGPLQAQPAEQLVEVVG
jgi:hypothetical protein